jgi:hypothetical protein
MQLELPWVERFSFPTVAFIVARLLETSLNARSLNTEVPG